MIALIVIFGIIAFLTLILLASFTIYVKITDVVLVEMGALGYKKTIYFSAESEEDRKKKAEKKAEAKNRKEIKEAKKEEKAAKKKAGKVKKATKNKGEKTEADEQSFAQTVSYVISVMKSLVPKAVDLLKHLRFERVIIKMTVVSDEADKTAIHYGMIGGGIYTLLGVLSNTFKVKIKCVEIAPDFDSDKAKYDISFKAKLRLIFILYSLIIMFISIVKQSFTGDLEKNDLEKNDFKKEE